MGPELKTEFRVHEDIILRTFRREDAEAVFAAVHRNLDRLSPYMHWATPEYSAEMAMAFIENNLGSIAEKNSLGLGIFKGDGFVGSVGFVKFDWNARKTELGYWIDGAEEGRGTVSGACRVLIDYAFGELHFNRVEIRCAASNLRSAAIPERLGFRKEGVLRQSEMRNGVLHDFSVYGLLADEWARTRPIVER